MNATDQAKVIRKGFRIIREREFIHPVSEFGKEKEYIIVQNCIDFPNWSILARGFKSKSKRREYMKALLKDSMNIED